MNKLIKNIREYVGLSQQELADNLKTSFATINRWENSKAFPNKTAQVILYDFCKENNVPVCEMTLQRIQDEVDQINISNDRIILYHGSKYGIDGPIAPISRPKCDFGKGFYMGSDPMQALTLIFDYEKSKFYIVSLSLEELEYLDIPANLKWAMIVAYNRGKMDEIKETKLYDKYQQICTNKDLMIGSIANDRMFYVLESFFQGNITDLALVKSLSALNLGKQYVALTQKACDKVKIEKEISISFLERLFLEDKNEENRINGISLANKICRDYRREGKFFDEILEETKGE